MASDRFVHFKSGKVPSRDELRLALEDYLGGAGSIEENVHFLTAVLPGEPTHPLRRQTGVTPSALHVHDDLDGRFFEVHVASLHGESPKIDVITRSADEFTTNVADGFARLVVRWWKGTLEE